MFFGMTPFRGKVQAKLPVEIWMVLLIPLCRHRPPSKSFTLLGVRSALLWHPTKQRLCGMLTITDFILILLRLYRTEKATIGKNLEKHVISEWRGM